MRSSHLYVSNAIALMVSLLILSGVVVAVGAQSQEPKPVSLAGTPISGAQADTSPAEIPATGVLDGTWQGPTWGVRIAWSLDVWSVENELIDDGYEGLQLGTPDATAFIEAYEGFAGNAEQCLAGAERELRERENVVELELLDGRPLPDSGTSRGPANLFGLVATLPDGDSYRGVEYMECRTVVPGQVVLELTWQTTTRHFNDELPRASELFSAIAMPDS